MPGDPQYTGSVAAFPAAPENPHGRIPRGWTPHDLHRLGQLRELGLSWQDVADDLGRTRGSVEYVGSALLGLTQHVAHDHADRGWPILFGSQEARDARFVRASLRAQLHEIYGREGI